MPNVEHTKQDLIGHNVSSFVTYFSGNKDFQWNLTFIKVDLVHSLPPCYYEFLGVDHSNTGIYYSDHTGYFGFYEARIYDLQLCGVHNKIHLYAQHFDIDIIYVNKGVESESDFSVLFQIMDYKLVNSDKTNFRFMRDEVIYSQQSLSIGQILKIKIFYLKIGKLSTIILHIASNNSYHIYDGGVIATDFKVKPFKRTMQLSSFQCAILAETNTTNYLKYGAIEKNFSSTLTLREGDRISVQLPIPKCQYRYGQHCVSKVSFHILISLIMVKNFLDHHCVN